MASFGNVSVTGVSCTIQCHAWFLGGRVEEDAVAPEIYLFEPEEMSHLPYWSVSSEEQRAVTPVGLAGSRIHWTANGWDTHSEVSAPVWYFQSRFASELTASAIITHVGNLMSSRSIISKGAHCRTSMTVFAYLSSYLSLIIHLCSSLQTLI